MAQIGNSTASSSTVFATEEIYLASWTDDVYTAGANEEAYIFYVYVQNNMTGIDLDVAIYDITSSSTAGTLVGQATVAGTSGGGWTSLELGTPIALTEGQKYAVAVLAKGTGFSGRTTSDYHSPYVKQQGGQSSFPATMSSDDTSNFSPAVYALTQSSGGGGGVIPAAANHLNNLNNQ